MSGTEDLNIDELLKELEQAEQRKNPEVTLSKKEREVSRGIRKFIQEKQIIAGEEKVPNYFIYQMYLDFEKHTPKESKIEFFRQFNKLFTAKRSAKVRYYLLNSDTLDFTQEALDKAKQQDAERNK